MALTRTTLTAAILSTDLTIPVTSSTSFLVGQPVKIDGEYIGAITAVPSTTSIVVRGRGWEGTVANAHAVLAGVETCPLATVGSDFPPIPPGNVSIIPPSYPAIVTVGANGVIAVPTQNTLVLLTKATALASTTLGAPSTANDGVLLTITNETAAAHVITATSLIADAVSGSPHTTLTFGAFKGASISLCAANGLWNVLSATVCVVT